MNDPIAVLSNQPGKQPTPDEISLAFTNLEITRERLEEGKPMLMIDRTETQRALNILQTAFGDQDEANNDGLGKSSARPEPLARDEPQPDTENGPGGEQWPSARPFTEERLASVTRTPCLVENYIFQDVAVLAGAGGSNKTTLAIWESIHLALGRPLYGLDTKRSRTLFVTAEDGDDEVALSLRELMFGLSLTASERSEVLAAILVVDVVGREVRFCDVGRGGNVSVSRYVGSFIERYRDLSPGIVYFDPLASFGPSEELGNAGLQGVIFAARRIMRAMNCCVRIVHHTGQASFRETMRDQYAMRGATALSDGARMVAILTRAKLDDNSPFGADDSSYVLSRPKLRFCKPQGEIFIKRDGFRFEWSHRIEESPAESERQRATQLETFLISQLSQGIRHTSREFDECLYASLGMKRSEGRKALAKLRMEGRVTNAPLPKGEQIGAKNSYLHPGRYCAEKTAT